MAGRYVSDVIKEEVPRMRGQRYTLDRIASELGISRRTVSRILNPEKTTQRKEWRRANVIHTTMEGRGGWHRVRKRPNPIPGQCELCKERPLKLQYHHWDDNHPQRGLWVCPTCHYFVEGVDSGLTSSHLEEYLRLKNIIT